jgi:hypothetical protein
MSAKQSVVSLVSSADSGKQTARTETRLLRQEGAMAGSSSSKEDDQLSQSSGETEAMAMATLDRLHSDNNNEKRPYIPPELLDDADDGDQKTKMAEKRKSMIKSHTVDEKKHDFYDRERKRRGRRGPAN